LERLVTLANEEKQKTPETGGPEISKMEAAFVLFELNHPIEALLAITTAEEAEKSEERKSAHDALKLLLAQLNSLTSENYIAPEQYQKLKERFQRLSRAVGIISGGKVDHTR
jgi:hypothetical protein